MQVGMVGLGRMGSNLVRRLMRAGHECVVYDVNPLMAEPLEAQGATVAADLDAFIAALDAAARRMGDGAGGVRGRDRSGHRGTDGARRHRHRRRQHLLPRRHRPRRQARGIRRPLRGHRHQWRGVRTRTRVLPDDRWGSRGGGPPRPDPRDDCARRRRRAADRRSDRSAVDRRAGLSPLRPGRRRTFREDGPQRHRVRDDGRVRRGPERPAPRRTRAPRPAITMPRPRRCGSRSTTSTSSTCPRSPRCGAAGASCRRGSST